MKFHPLLVRGPFSINVCDSYVISKICGAPGPTRAHAPMQGYWGPSAGSWGPTRAHGAHAGPSHASGPTCWLLGPLLGSGAPCGLLGPHHGLLGLQSGSLSPSGPGGLSDPRGPAGYLALNVGAPGAQHGFRGLHASSWGPQIKICGL